MTENEIVVRQGNFIAPVADVETALRRYQAVKDFIASVLKENVDFGTIPGADKPSLLKAGAEKMTAFFGFSVRYILADYVEDWTGDNHNGEPFFSYRYRAQLWRGNELIAEGEGSCNSWEKKYRYRQAERVCPKCGKSAIIPGKKEYGGGWLCFTKKGGCNAKFLDNAPEIMSQQLGQIKNPDPADLVNTIQKMAQKRALVAPVLIATNTSDYFTQDIEDYIDGTVVEQSIHSEAIETQSKPAPQPVPPTNGDMTYEEAIKVTDSKGKYYSSVSNKGLVVIQKNISNKINNESPADQSRHQRALEAIGTILQHDPQEKRFDTVQPTLAVQE